MTGDTDFDGQVDVTDLNNVRNNFGASADGIPGDTNDDDMASIDDLNAARNNFGAVMGSAATSPRSGQVTGMQKPTRDASWTTRVTKVPGALGAASVDVLFTAIGAEATPAGAKPRRSPWGAR